MCSQVREGAQTAQIKAGRQAAPSIDRKLHLFSGSCFSRRSQVERWHVQPEHSTSAMSYPLRLLSPLLSLRLLLAVPGCLCDALLRSLLLPGPSGSSHLHHILHINPFPHHPSSSTALSVLKTICSVLGIVCIFLFTVLLKAGGDIFHALIMGAYIYIPVYVPYLAMASGLIPGTRSKGWTGSPRYECRRAKRRQERQLLQQIQAMRSAKGCRLLSSLSMRLNTRYHLHAIAFLHLL